MANLKWTAEAEKWLRDIYRYIAADNPHAAERVVEGIYQKAQILIRHPRSGYRYEPVVDREVRILLYGHYRIAYLIKHDDTIDVLGVFHGAMDISLYEL